MMIATNNKPNKTRLVKPSSPIQKHKVQAYSTESGNTGCTQCQSGCYNCGCKTRCGSCSSN